MSPTTAPLSNEIVEEREALEDLVQSKGWRIFESYLSKEWQGIGYYRRMDTILTSSKPEEAIVLHRASREITAAIRWPYTRVKELTEARK